MRLHDLLYKLDNNDFIKVGYTIGGLNFQATHSVETFKRYDIFNYEEIKEIRAPKNGNLTVILEKGRA